MLFFEVIVDNGRVIFITKFIKFIWEKKIFKICCNGVWLLNTFRVCSAIYRKLHHPNQALFDSGNFNINKLHYERFSAKNLKVRELNFYKRSFCLCNPASMKKEGRRGLVCLSVIIGI